MRNLINDGKSAFLYTLQEPLRLGRNHLYWPQGSGEASQRDYPPIPSSKSLMAPQDKLSVCLMPVGSKMVGNIVKDKEIPPEDSGQSKHAFIQHEKVNILKINTHFCLHAEYNVNFFTLLMKKVDTVSYQTCWSIFYSICIIFKCRIFFVLFSNAEYFLTNNVTPYYIV